MKEDSERNAAREKGGGIRKRPRGGKQSMI